jgi:prepilin-type N-terminal cleavage/methylation domain-containing protein/prepilin-type processing-associated H-X9-DG protein
MAHRRKPGFTLVELLVVISIIGMLVALLLPAINSVRENARRTTCSNNSRQIALAMVSYVTSKDSFPGYRGNRVGPTSSTLPAMFDGSWFVAIAPQLQQSVIKDRYDQMLLSQPPIFPYVDFAVCASDPAEQLTPAAGSPISHLSYVVNAGRVDSTTVPLDNAANGVFHNAQQQAKSPKLTLDSIKDGAMFTLMLSENIQATIWSHASANDQVLEGDVAFIFRHETGAFDGNGEVIGERWRINGMKANSAPGTTPRPSSNHPGGVNVAFCDARTLFLKEDIHYRVLQQLMTPDGYHPSCDVPSTQNGQPVGNKAYILNSADYTSQ